MNICVYGAASDKIEREYFEKVEALGEKMAKCGHDLVFGAGGTGLMGAAARGVQKGGGRVCGVIPNFFKEADIEIIYKQCTEIIYTETMRERKAIMEERADGFIVVPGGIGTFEEFFEILTLKQLGRHTKPIAVYNINGYYDALEDMMTAAVVKDFVPEKTRELYRICDNAEDILDYIENDNCEAVDIKLMKN